MRSLSLLLLPVALTTVLAQSPAPSTAPAQSIGDREGPARVHADLQREGPHRLARQQDQPPRHDARLPRRPRRDRRHAEPARRQRHRQGRHPADRQEVQERRSLHGGQARLGLRQRPVPALQRGRRSLPGDARLPARRHDGRHLRRGPEGRRLGAAAATRRSSARRCRRSATETWQKAWKREEWNSVRARIEGDVPHITVWINGQLVTDWTDTANHAAGGATTACSRSRCTSPTRR